MCIGICGRRSSSSWRPPNSPTPVSKGYHYDDVPARFARVMFFRKKNRVSLNLISTCNRGCSYCIQEKDAWYRELRAKAGTDKEPVLRIMPKFRHDLPSAGAMEPIITMRLPPARRRELAVELTALLGYARHLARKISGSAISPDDAGKALAARWPGMSPGACDSTLDWMKKLSDPVS